MGPEYRLAHGQGFRADAPGGRVGLVEAVVRRAPEEAKRPGLTGC